MMMLRERCEDFFSAQLMSERYDEIFRRLISVDLYRSKTCDF